MKNKLGKTSLKILALDALIIVFSITAAVQLVEFVHRYNTLDGTYRLDDVSLLYELKGKNYMALLSDIYKKENDGSSFDEEADQLKNVAFYYESAAMYKAYLESNDTAKAEDKKKLMSEYASGMGEFSYAAEDICDELKIKP